MLSWIAQVFIRLAVWLPVNLLWTLLKQDWKEQDEKKKREESKGTSSENKP